MGEKAYTAGLNDGLQCVVDYLAAGGFEVFGIEPWGGGLPLDRPACTVHIARAIPRESRPEKAD
jgi:hypothetical protein